MVSTRVVESEERKRAFREEYLRSLAAPIDSFWEGVVLPRAECLELFAGGEAAGHCLIGEKRTLQQFRVSPALSPLAHALFGHLVEAGLVERAAVSTREPEYLSLCLDRMSGAAVDSYLFSDSRPARANLEGFPSLSFRPAGLGDIAAVREDCEPAFDGYYEGLVGRGELFVLHSATALLGIGELRTSSTHPLYADMGLCVAGPFRGKGVGTYILAKLKDVCRGRGLRPMASCDVKNAASRRALEKAGLAAGDRMIIASFAPRG